jgi:acetoin utilization protein AcuB
MFIHYYMTPEPVTIRDDITVGEASTLIAQHSFRHLPVVDEQMTLRGMVTDRDLRSACPSTILEDVERQEILERVGTRPVNEIMSENLYRISETATIDDALFLFTSHAVGALPVVNTSNQVVGIFSVNDMLLAYRNIFGLAEKGSMLIAVEDSGEKQLFATIANELAEHDIGCNRMVRTPGTMLQDSAAIYLRVNTCNKSLVRRVMEKVGVQLLPADQKYEGGAVHA